MKYLSLRTSQFIFIVSFLFSVIPSFAQQNQGKIRGQITTSDGKPAADVNIILKNSKYSTITNDEGIFEINRVKENTYILQISLTGYETSEQEVIVEENKTAIINLQLKVSNKELQEVVINNRKSLLSKKNRNCSQNALEKLRKSTSI